MSNLIVINCQELMDQIIQVRHVHPQEEYRLCEQLKDLAIKTDNTYALCFAKLYQADSLYYMGQVEDALAIGLESLEVQLKSNFTDLIIVQCNLIALLYKQLDDEQSAMEHFLRSLKLAKNENNYMMLSAIYCNLTNLYLKQRAYEQAEETLLLSKEAYYKANDNKQNVNTSSILLNLTGSTIEYHKKNYEETIAFTTSILHKYTYEQMPSIYVFCLLLEAKTYCQQNEYSVMRDRIHELLSLSLTSFNPLVCQDIYMDIIDVCLMSEWITPLDALFEAIYPNTQTLNLPCKWVSYYDRYIRYCTLLGTSSKEEEDAYEQYYYWSCKHDSFIKHATLARIQNRSALFVTQKNKEKTQKLKDSLQNMAICDELTGIPNRHGLNQYLKHTFHMAKVEQMSFCVIITDIDYFKEYNDTYGHLKGDDCLKQISRVLQQFTRDNGYVARYGGDEFILIFLNRSIVEVKQTVRTIIKNVEELQIQHSTSNVSDYVTITMGGVHYIPSSNSDIMDYIHAADSALYHIKKTSRNAFYIDVTC